MNHDIGDAIEARIEKLAEQALSRSRAFNLSQCGEDALCYPFAFWLLKTLFTEELHAFASL